MSNNITIGDIVKFKQDSAISHAAKFCAFHGVTGVVTGTDRDRYSINVGFEYLVYAKPTEFDVIVGQSEIPINSDCE